MVGKGTFTYDNHIEGEGDWPEKQTILLVGVSVTVTRGREIVKPIKIAHVICEWSPAHFLVVWQCCWHPRAKDNIQDL